METLEDKLIILFLQLATHKTDARWKETQEMTICEAVFIREGN